MGRQAKDLLDKFQIDMDENSKNIRSTICEHIGVLASSSLQIKYEKDVPIADVPAELICMFSDWYHPKYKPFLDAFNEDEIKDLAVLYGLLHLASQKISEPKGMRVADLQKLPEWRRVMTFAKDLQARIKLTGG